MFSLLGYVLWPIQALAIPLSIISWINSFFAIIYLVFTPNIHNTEITKINKGITSGCGKVAVLLSRCIELGSRKAVNKEVSLFAENLELLQPICWCRFECKSRMQLCASTACCWEYLTECIWNFKQKIRGCFRSRRLLIGNILSTTLDTLGCNFVLLRSTAYCWEYLTKCI